jgi:protein-disulfide isomerase
MIAPNRSFLIIVLLACLAATSVPGQVLNYSGRISVDGTSFNGTGFFVFSIHDTSGEILWASGDFPQAGATKHPVATWQLAARDGIYQTRLGDTTAGMPALDTARVLAAKDPFLRVWFHDGSNRGWQAAGDTPIKPVLAGKIAAAPATHAAAISGTQADTILRELREMRALVQQQQAATKPATPEPPKIITVPLGDSPSLGEATAPVVLVEFTDFQCFYCKRAHDDVLAAVRTKFVNTGKLRLVSRSLPLPFHANAEPAAHAALCAGAQDQFWPMRDRLFINQEALAQKDLLQAAEELKLDAKAFAACLEGKNFASQIARDKQDAAAAGITGTPTFVLGRANGSNVTGLLMVGAKPLATFEAEIEKLLSNK